MADPILPGTGSRPCATFSLLTKHTWKDKASNVFREEENIIPCLAWDKNAELARKRLYKGSRVYVEGRLRSIPGERAELIINRLIPL